MLFKYLILFLISFTSFAEGLTLVAVGEAELMAEKLVVREPYIDGSFSTKEVAAMNEMAALMRNDFSFYKKNFSVQIVGKNPLKSFESLNFSDLKSKAVQYLLRIQFSKSGQNVKFDFEAWDTLKGEKLVSDSGVMEVNNVRAIGHKLADMTYRKITGKASIFNSKITFVSDVYSKKSSKDKTTELFIMDFDGRNVRKLTSHNSVVLSPAFSHDGQKILYSLIDTKVSKTRNVSLRMIDLQTGDNTVISNKSGINSGAVFMPDGNSIALTLSHVGNAEIFIMDLNTKALTRVTRHYAPDVDPSISVDGSLMTFLSGRPGKPMIYTMDPRGEEKDVKRISYVGRFNATPRFSPDGKEIAFASWLDERFDIFRINSDGTGLSRLTKDFGSNEDPTYSNDGQFIAFSSQRVISSRSAVQNIYIMDREGEIIGQITDNFGNCITPRWSKY